MSLLTKVKVSQVTNLSDARYCSGMGVHYLGFNFVENNENYVDPTRFMEIKSWISGPAFVGEFDDTEISEIRALPHLEALDLIEITQPDNVHELSLLGKPVMLKLDISNYSSQSSLEDHLILTRELVDYFLIERTSGKSKYLEEVLTLSHHYPILLGFGISKENIHHLIRNSGIRGIALRGEREEKVGFKDYQVLADILEELEIE
jgi:phosphoribosylanthranilate isomerase